MKNNQGALIITFIVFFTMVGILASSLAYFLQNVPYAIKSVNSVEQSYYLAESGLRYVLMKIKEGNDYNELKDKYEYGERVIHIPKTAARHIQRDSLVGNFSLKFNKGELQKRRDMFIHSYAMVDTDTFVESKRQLNAEYDDPNDFNIDFSEDHFDQDASDRDRIWNLTDSFSAKIGSVSSIPSLLLKSNQQQNWVLASLNWGKNDKLPDLRLYQYVITKVLSYKIQIKINCYPVYGQKGRDFMAGLNFRVMNSTRSGRKDERIEYYGISLFKSAGRQQGNPPCWLIPDSNDCRQHLGESFLFEGEDGICQEDPSARCLKPNMPYVIFWVKTLNSDNIELLAYSHLRDLQDADSYTENLKGYGYGFKDWLNIGLFLKEKESAGQKINEAQIGLRATNEKNWTFPLKLRFAKVSQNDPGSTTTFSDRTLVSRDLSIVNQTPPDEIGFHALYDNRIISSYYKYNIYFRDFLLDCHGEYCPEKSTKLYVQF